MELLENLQEVVSILVLLDVALKGIRGRASSSDVIVSILVLLDVALKEPIRPQFADHAKKFQSLFSWMLL